MKLQSFNASRPFWSHIAGLQLADPDFSYSGPVHIIIGSDNYGSMILPGLIRGDSSSLVAQQTIFEWVFSRPISTHDTSLPTPVYHFTLDQDSQEFITRFWTQEEIYISINSTLSADEEKYERHFTSTYSRNVTRCCSLRYVVRLPLKSDSTVLGESKTRILSCLKRLFQQFSVNSVLQHLYVDFIEEYRNLGYMVPADISNSLTSPTYYLPHHGVLGKIVVPSSWELCSMVQVALPTIVRNDLSLNDILHAEAKLQANMSDILLYLAHTDSSSLQTSSRCFDRLRYIPTNEIYREYCWQEPSGQPVSYQLTTVMYGFNCDPFLVLRTI